MKALLIWVYVLAALCAGAVLSVWLGIYLKGGYLVFTAFGMLLSFVIPRRRAHLSNPGIRILVGVFLAMCAAELLARWAGTLRREPGTFYVYFGMLLSFALGCAVLVAVPRLDGTQRDFSTQTTPAMVCIFLGAILTNLALVAYLFSAIRLPGGP